MPFRDAVQFLKTELVTTRLQFAASQRAHHQRRRLRTGGRVLGGQEHSAVLRDAGHEAGAAGPLHRGDGVSSDGQRVIEAQNVRVLTDAHIIARNG